jgi:hypothetical protein
MLMLAEILLSLSLFFLATTPAQGHGHYAKFGAPDASFSPSSNTTLSIITLVLDTQICDARFCVSHPFLHASPLTLRTDFLT